MSRYSRLTEFGKIFRKARIDAGLKIQDMANELQVSPAFISSIETGRKKMPGYLAEDIIKYFSDKGVDVDLSQCKVLVESVDYV